MQAMAVPATFALIMLGVGLLAACGGSNESAEMDATNAAPPSTVAEPPASEAPRRDEDAGGGKDQDRGGDGGAERARRTERAVQRAASEYVDALDRGDGAAVCAALAEGAIDAVELPRERGGCDASLGASIGYRDPRGVPVFAGAELVAFAGVELLDAESARVTATVVTDFADRDEPSIEDDVMYLTREQGRWRLAKASPTLYRAIGAAEVPPNALTPP